MQSHGTWGRGGGRGRGGRGGGRWRGGRDNGGHRGRGGQRRRDHRGTTRGGPGFGGQQQQHLEQDWRRSAASWQDNDFIETIGNPSGSDDSSSSSVCVAIEGCSHGELDAIYDRLSRYNANANDDNGRAQVDLLVCCGDFQSLRNLSDFHSIACPPKYRSLGSFHRYYSGEKVAPVLTVFVGGNHEASQPLQELHYGGWVAPNIYYLGAVGVVNFAGLRIGGISGIYKSHDYALGRFERPPYDRSEMRSVYHVRSADVYRMKCLDPSGRRLDIMISHDWPQGIERHGDTSDLLRRKPFFRDEVRQNSLGSPCNRELLEALQPKWWFAAHLHVKFRATVKHDDAPVNQDEASSPREVVKATTTTALLVPSQVIGSSSSPAKNNNWTTTPIAEEKTTSSGKAAAKADGGGAKATEGSIGADKKETKFLAAESTDPCSGPDLSQQMTQFLALDKCLPRRSYLAIVHVPVDDDDKGKGHAEKRLEYDVEWLAILKKTHRTGWTTGRAAATPGDPVRVTEQEMEWVRERLGASPAIPLNFTRTVPAHRGPASPLPGRLPPPLPVMGNPQTDRLLAKLELQHVFTVPYNDDAGRQQTDSRTGDVDGNEIDLEEVHEEEEAVDANEELGDAGDVNELQIDDDEDHQAEVDSIMIASNSSPRDDVTRSTSSHQEDSSSTTALLKKRRRDNDDGAPQLT